MISIYVCIVFCLKHVDEIAITFDNQKNRIHPVSHQCLFILLGDMFKAWFTVEVSMTSPTVDTKTMPTGTSKIISTRISASDYDQLKNIAAALFATKTIEKPSISALIRLTVAGIVNHGELRKASEQFQVFQDLVAR